MPSRLLALTEALIANLIWASTFVLVKIGLTDIQPLSLAGWRYFSAFVLLSPFIFAQRKNAQKITLSTHLRLFVLGLCAYPLANGALFWGLKFTGATTASLVLALTPLFILIIGVFWLREIPTLWQVAGLFIALFGSFLFFSTGIDASEPLGLALVMVAMGGLALFGILGREIARDQRVDTLTLTALPLAFGGGVLLLIALAFEGIDRFTTGAVFVIAWLAIFNTVVAYTLYNHSLRQLTAFESNAMMNIAPLGTAALAWIMLGEAIEAIQWVGMITVIVGVFLIQMKPSAAPQID